MAYNKSRYAQLIFHSPCHLAYARCVEAFRSVSRYIHALSSVQTHTHTHVHTSLFPSLLLSRVQHITFSFYRRPHTNSRRLFLYKVVCQHSFVSVGKITWKETVALSFTETDRPIKFITKRQTTINRKHKFQIKIFFSSVSFEKNRKEKICFAFFQLSIYKAKII